MFRYIVRRYVLDCCNSLRTLSAPAKVPLWFLFRMGSNPRGLWGVVPLCRLDINLGDWGRLHLLGDGADKRLSVLAACRPRFLPGSDE